MARTETSLVDPNQTSLSAAVATGGGTEYDTNGRSNLTMQTNATNVTTGGTVLLEGSLDGINWTTLATDAITGNGTTFVEHGNSDTQSYYPKVRARLSIRTDGTYTSFIAAGGG